jgi:hypothetical protein
MQRGKIYDCEKGSRLARIQIEGRVSMPTMMRERQLLGSRPPYKYEFAVGVGINPRKKPPYNLYGIWQLCRFRRILSGANPNKSSVFNPRRSSNPTPATMGTERKNLEVPFLLLVASRVSIIPILIYCRVLVPVPK